MTANLGDTAVFTWGGTHNVFIHPAHTCNTGGATEVGVDPPASYTFTEAGEVTFSCDVFIGAHCYAGQILTFTVSDPAAEVDEEEDEGGLVACPMIWAPVCGADCKVYVPRDKK